MVDHATQTIHVRPGLDLAEMTAVVAAGVQALCRGCTVVVDEDGTAWSSPPASAATASGDVCSVPAPRRHLHLVPASLP